MAYTYVNTEASTFVARFGTTPTEAREAAIDNLFGALKSGAISGSNIYAKLDAFWLLAAHASADSRLNAKSTSHTCTLVQSPTFVVDRGWTGVASPAGFLDTNRAGNAAGNFQQNSASYGVWELSNVASNSGAMGITTGQVALCSRSGANSSFFSINDWTQLSIASTDSRGLCALNRSASNARQVYKNGASIGSDTTVSTTRSTSNFIVCTSTTGFPINREIAFAFVGASLTANEHLDLYNAVRAYLIATNTIGHALTVTGVASTSHVDQPLLTSGSTHALTATDVASATSVGSPTLSQTHALTVTGVASATSVDIPTLTSGVPSNFADQDGNLITDEVGNQIVVEPLDQMTAVAVSAQSSVGSPALSQTHALTATGVASATSVSSPALNQTHALTATGVASATSVDSPALSQIHALTVTGIASATSVSSSALSQIHALTTTGVSSATSVGSPVLATGQTHALTVTGVASATSVSSPALSQIHALTATGVSSATSVSSPTLGQKHAFTASGVASTTSVGLPGLVTGITYARLLEQNSNPITDEVGNYIIIEPYSQISYALTAVGVASATSVQNPILTQGHALVVTLGVTSTTHVSSPALTQKHAINATGVSSTSHVGLPTLFIIATGVVASGGTITTSGSSKIHTFTGNGNFVLTDNGGQTFDILLVAGGGSGGTGGGSPWGAGGGGGGVLQLTGQSLVPGTYPIVVGAGGAVQSGVSARGLNGANSTGFGQTAIGGGGGGGGAASTSSGSNGGSGGGGGGRSAMAPGGSGTAGQGNAGGPGNPSGTAADAAGGGGGGAGAVGSPGATAAGGAGGPGIQINFNGTLTRYGPGGGGAGTTVGAGGLGGGGAGASGGANGVAPTGIGAGSGGVKQGDSAAGSAGIVMIRYSIGVLLPVNVVSDTSVGTPALGQRHLLSVTGSSSTSHVATPALGQRQALTATGLSATSHVAAPALGYKHALTAVGVNSTSHVAAPALSSTSALVAVGVSSTSHVGTPLMPIFNLEAVGVYALSHVGNPLLGIVHALSTNGLISVSTVGQPLLSTGSLLEAIGVYSTTYVDTPGLATTFSLLPVSIVAATHVGTPRSGAVPLGIKSTSHVGTPALSQKYVLVPANGGIYSTTHVGKPIIYVAGSGARPIPGDKSKPAFKALVIQHPEKNVDSLHQTMVQLKQAVENIQKLIELLDRE